MLPPIRKENNGMHIKMILFDLDGTLLPMDQDVFVKTYMGMLAEHLAPLGYAPKAFFDAMWAGTGAMVKNDGTKSNEDAFWNTFCQMIGKDARVDMPRFEQFYIEKFDQVQGFCGYTPQAAQVIRFLKTKGLRTALATNPLFPGIATEKRIAWAGLSPDDFELYTTYETERYCKPNPCYYRTVAERLGVKPEECLMVGNDVSDDMVAEELGMQVFLLTDCLINKDNVDISRYPQGGFDELIDYIDGLNQENTI